MKWYRVSMLSGINYMYESNAYLNYYELDSISTAAVFGIPSNNGIIDVSEGIFDTTFIDATGFSYGAVPIKISTLTYSEYAARGFNLEDDFSPSVIPANAADGEYVRIASCKKGLRGFIDRYNIRPEDKAT